MLRRVAVPLCALLAACAGSLDQGSVSCRTDNECPTGAYCGTAGKCAAAPACAPGTSLCHDQCSDLTSSMANCGACGQPCTAPANGTAACQASACVVTCTAPAVKSGAGCLLPPGTPTVFQAHAGDNGVNLTWAASSDASSWIVLRGTSAAGPFQQTPVSGPSYSDTSAAPGTTYQYELVAVNAAGRSAATSPVPVLTFPALVQGLSLLASGQSITVTWSVVSGASSYSILRGPPGGVLLPLAVGITGTTYPDSGLTAGTTDQYEIRAVNASGPGPLSPPCRRMP